MPTLETATQPQNAERPAVAGEPCVLLKLGQIVLKGKNRELFERRLQNNIRAAVKGLGIKVQIWQREGVIVVRAESGELADVDAVARRPDGPAPGPRRWRAPPTNCIATGSSPTPPGRS